MNKAIISNALSRLNDINNGAKKFEIFCQELISNVIDPDFLPSSGQDSGGDGGLDGWSSLGQNEKAKYAFSINKSVKKKISIEIKNTDPLLYQEIRYFTNQPVKQSDKEKYNNSSDDNGFRIIIYDLDNLIEFVDKHEELGEYIDLPWVKSNITIDYLKKHNQLLSHKNEISQFIPRTISYLDNDSKNWKDVSLSKYISCPPLFTLIIAPAGYGKTCVLQQMHQKILDREINTLLPPVFISLSSYIPTTLLVTIKDKMFESGDYRCNDMLLLLDGYDEVKDSERELLIKEIRQIIENSGFIRKVVLSVRENTFNYSDFEVFDDFNITSLCKITTDDIRVLFSIESITVENESEFFNNSFFKEFSDNIFYVVKFIDFFKSNNTIAGNVTDLFEFIINQEIRRIFKKDRPDERKLESLALFMTLNQILEIDDEEISSMLGICLPMSPFRFSHKSIQEYLAARIIVKQHFELIKKILAKGNKIIPYLTNTLGFVLNILNVADEKQDTFENIVNWTLEGFGNAKRLLQIEADKISPSMNHKIFSAVLDQEAKIGNLFNQPEALVPFGLRKESRKVNIEYLITQIKSLRDTNNYHYYTSVLQSIAYHHLYALDEFYQESLLNFLNELLLPESINKNQDFIESLLYSIVYFPILKNLNNNKINFLVTQLLSIEKSENIVNNLCQLLLTADNRIEKNVYLQIYEFILYKILLERGQMAHSVSTQTSDDTYHDLLRVTHWHSFIPLTKKLLADDPLFIWELMKYTIANNEKLIDRHSSSSELDDLFQVFFEVLKHELETHEINDVKKEIIIEWIICDSKAYRDSKLWVFLSERFDSVFMIGIAKDVIQKAGRQFFNREIMDFFINKGILTEDAFDFFKMNFYIENESLKSFFESFCHWIKEEHPIYQYVLLNIPSVLKEVIQKSRLTQGEYILQSEQEKITLKKDYHIAFNGDEVAVEIEKIFNYFGTDKITKKDFWESYHQRLLNEINKFALYLFQSSFWAKEEEVKKEQIMEYLGKDNWNNNFMTFLIQYSSRNQLDMNGFTDEEKQKIKLWVKSVLEKYPLVSINSQLKYIHITLSHVLRNSNFLSNDNELMNIYKEKMIGLSFSAFPNVMEGAIMVSYNSYSIDYLDKYISSKVIIEFIFDNIFHAFSDYQKVISICGYLTGHINDVLPFQKRKMKGEIKEYIESHLNENYYPSITECAFALGFSIMEIDLDHLSNAFILDEKGQDLAHNYAASFIRHQAHENTEAEVQHLLKALHKAFLKSQDDFHKKTIAEYYLKYNSMNEGIFIFYAEYLMRDDDHPILNQLIRGSTTPLKTANIDHIEIVSRLFRYSRAKDSKSERRDGILSIAISSFKAMADTISEREDLDLVLDSMRILAEEGYDFLYRQMQEIENDFVERTYKPLSVKEILVME